MTKEEAEFQVLMSEKEHADKQISSYLELQLKLLAFLLGTGSAVLGFVFAKGDKSLKPPEIAVIILVACFAGCVLMLQSVVTYGIALGYIHYKKATLAPRLRDLFLLGHEPALSVKSFGDSPARYPVFMASGALALVHALATSALLTYASYLVSAKRVIVASFVACWVLLIITLAIEVALARAMREVGSA